MPNMTLSLDAETHRLIRSHKTVMPRLCPILKLQHHPMIILYKTNKTFVEASNPIGQQLDHLVQKMRSMHTRVSTFNLQCVNLLPNLPSAPTVLSIPKVKPDFLLR